MLARFGGAHLPFRPEGTQTYQPRATPWDPLKPKKPNAGRNNAAGRRVRSDGSDASVRSHAAAGLPSFLCGSTIPACSLRNGRTYGPSNRRLYENAPSRAPRSQPWQATHCLVARTAPSIRTPSTPWVVKMFSPWRSA